MVERYKCQNCGEVFMEPRERTWNEYHGHHLIEHWLSLECPICGSEEIDEFTEDGDA